MEEKKPIVSLTFVVECLVSKDGTKAFVLRYSNGSPVEFSHQFADISETILSVISQAADTVNKK